MKYGIYPLGNNGTDVYAWRFDSLEDAKNQAIILCKKYKSDFIVFEVIGTFKNHAVWEDMTDKDNAGTSV